MRILILFRNFPQLFSKIFCLESLIVFNHINHFRVTQSLLCSLFGIIINFFEETENIQNRTDLTAKYLTMSFLLFNEFLDLFFIKMIEYFPNESVFNQEFAVLLINESIFFFKFSCFIILFFNLSLYLLSIYSKFFSFRP